MYTSFSHLNLLNEKNFRPVQNERFCRRKINVTQKLNFALERLQNNVGKGENAGYCIQNYIVFKSFLPRVVKSQDFRAQPSTGEIQERYE